ncbi:ketopantoate reductase family protein [Marinobacter zhejiangensis]|uniref:2-dehydropantoate 2-reductase n=1 Tax=Marinobacter zhejiangensis TaxID=488535 RepID=A0A1I4RCF9_9GAMM|nr:2-dehydropantoate 2-reductase [Marinobacter zhejiangensis]SFM49972.1 ketopantoate reductase [Marinobacter zhejiangensis]
MPAPRHQESTPANNGLTLILGAGAMGRLWAASLPAGQTRFLARAGTTPPAPYHYQFQNIHGDHQTVEVPFAQANDLPKASCLLVATKAPDTLAALKEHVSELPHYLPILLFQNGMGSQQQVAAQWPERPILAAVTTEGANRPTHEFTVHAGKGQTWLGPLTDAAVGIESKLLEHLSTSGLAIASEPNIQQRLWQKLIINAGINPFTAILNCANGDILQHPFYLDHIDALCLELQQLMAAEGMVPKSSIELRKNIEAVARATAANTSSMRADTLHKRPTEIDFINGYVTRRGKELGLDLAVNRMLTEQVKILTND